MKVTEREIHSLRNIVESARVSREALKRTRAMLEGNVVDRRKVASEIGEVSGVLENIRDAGAGLLGVALLDFQGYETKERRCGEG